MKVYVVLLGADYEGSSIQSVWSTSEAAEKAAGEVAEEYLGDASTRSKNGTYVLIEKYTLDE